MNYFIVPKNKTSIFLQTQVICNLLWITSVLKLNLHVNVFFGEQVGKSKVFLNSLDAVPNGFYRRKETFL